MRCRLRRGTGAAGLSPGGEGIDRDVEVLEDCTVSLITERRKSQPWGLAGGSPGACGENLAAAGRRRIEGGEVGGQVHGALHAGRCGADADARRRLGRGGRLAHVEPHARRGVSAASDPYWVSLPASMTSCTPLPGTPPGFSIAFSLALRIDARMSNIVLPKCTNGLPDITL
ncbi:MAG: hydantoinase B/oxoprolinase family protein [Acidimicrobiia bacterium]|nr:hydantoinase B/oxoprolinase family protein [Acidimicrobiia bacterium]